MDYAPLTLGEYERRMIRFVCSTCGRKEQHPRKTLLAKHGPKIAMSELLLLIAKCERRDGPTCGDCRVRYYFRDC